MKRSLALWVGLWSLLLVLHAGAAEKVLSSAGVRPGQGRAMVESLVGPPVLSDVERRMYHYPKSLIVYYDAGDQVISVHGTHLEIDGKSLGDDVVRQDVEKELGAGAPGAVSGMSLLRYPRYGLTVYLHGDAVTGVLLETPQYR